MLISLMHTKKNAKYEAKIITGMLHSAVQHMVPPVGTALPYCAHHCRTSFTKLAGRLLQVHNAFPLAANRK